MYTVYGNVKSRTFRVLWMLEELGVPYTHVPAPPQSDEIRAVSALGKVPVLPDRLAIFCQLNHRPGGTTGLLPSFTAFAFFQRLGLNKKIAVLQQLQVLNAFFMMPLMHYLAIHIHHRDRAHLVHRCWTDPYGNERKFFQKHVPAPLEKQPVYR